MLDKKAFAINHNWKLVTFDTQTENELKEFIVAYSSVKNIMSRIIKSQMDAEPGKLWTY